MIAEKLFDLLEGSVLELGPHDGSWFSEDICARATAVCGIELDSIAAGLLRERCPSMRVVQADYHRALQGVGHYDSAVLFGVLTHSHAPLQLIEDLVIYVEPRRIFLESEPGGVVRCVREGVNQPGQRQSLRATCGLSIQLGTKVYTDALANLGYKPIRSYLETKGDKTGYEYTVYEKDLHINTP